MTDCPICNHKEKEKLEEELVKGLPKTLVSNDLDCDVEDIVEHMDEHFSGGSGDVEEYSDIDYMVTFEERESYKKFDILDQNMKRLVGRFDTIMQQDSYDRDDTEQIVKMAREIRQTAMSIAELEGEIREELKLTEEQFNELKGVILRELDGEVKCPECGTKFDSKTTEKILSVIDSDKIEVEASK